MEEKDLEPSIISLTALDFFTRSAYSGELIKYKQGLSSHNSTNSSSSSSVHSSAASGSNAMFSMSNFYHA